MSRKIIFFPPPGLVPECAREMATDERAGRGDGGGGAGPGRRHEGGRGDVSGGLRQPERPHILLLKPTHPPPTTTIIINLPPPAKLLFPPRRKNTFFPTSLNSIALISSKLLKLEIYRVRKSAFYSL